MEVEKKNNDKVFWNSVWTFKFVSLNNKECKKNGMCASSQP